MLLRQTFIPATSCIMQCLCSYFSDVSPCQWAGGKTGAIQRAQYHGLDVCSSAHSQNVTRLVNTPPLNVCNPPTYLQISHVCFPEVFMIISQATFNLHDASVSSSLLSAIPLLFLILKAVNPPLQHLNTAFKIVFNGYIVTQYIESEVTQFHFSCFFLNLSNSIS